MKFLDRLGLGIFSILVLTISIVLVLIGFNVIEPSIFSVLISKVLISQQNTYIMIGICVVFILLALKCLFFSDSSKYVESEDGIQMQNEDGKLLITKSTISNIVDSVVMEIPNIDTAKAEVIIDKENNVSIDAIVDVKKNVVIKDVSAKLQTKIKKAVKDATDLDIKAVNIEIRKVQIEEENKEESNEE